MKILFLTSRLPFPPIGGDKLRTYNFIKRIKKEHQVTLISFIENENELNYADEYQQYYNKLITIKLPKLVSYLNSMKGLLSSEPLQIHYYSSQKMKDAVLQELKEGYDTIFCHLIRMAQYLPRDININKVIDFTDAISMNYLRSKNYRKGFFSIINRIESKRVLRYEQKTILQSDISIFISDIDAGFLRNGQNENKIRIVGNGVDLNKFRFYQGYYDENQISFVGNMRTFPNTDAVLYFTDEILPILMSKKPNLKFYIVGTNPNYAVKRLHNGKNIFVTGYVDSVIPYIQQSAVVVAPMRVGAGVQNKILEAMAIGTPVVTTTIGAEGLNSTKLLIGDGPEELAKHILTLIENPDLRRKFSKSMREYIERNFTWEKSLSKLDEILLSLHTKSPTVH